MNQHAAATIYHMFDEHPVVWSYSVRSAPQTVQGHAVPPFRHTRTISVNMQQFYVPPTQCIYVFCVGLSTNSDYFPIQH